MKLPWSEREKKGGKMKPEKLKGAHSHHNLSAHKPSSDELRRSQSCLGFVFIVAAFFFAAIIIEAAI